MRITISVPFGRHLARSTFLTTSSLLRLRTHDRVRETRPTIGKCRRIHATPCNFGKYCRSCNRRYGWGIARGVRRQQINRRLCPPFDASAQRRTAHERRDDDALCLPGCNRRAASDRLHHGQRRLPASATPATTGRSETGTSVVKTSSSAASDVASATAPADDTIAFGR
jgi:hypothetical protein